MIKCKYCNQVSGINRSGKLREVQRYFCKHCEKYFTLSANSKNNSENKTVITIKDLAKEIGVSISTISRALNGSKEIKEETRNLIIKKAEELNFHKNEIAASLVKRHTSLIGIIVPELHANFYINIINGADEIFKEKGYKIITMQSNDSYKNEIENINTLLSIRVDGIIASTTFETFEFKHFEKAKEKNIPIVLFSRINDSIECPKIVVDNYKGACMAVKHLLEMDYRKIGYIGLGKNFHIGNLRYQGYVDTLAEFKIKLTSKWIIRSDDLLTEKTKMIDSFLKIKDRPEAIFTMSDHIGIEVIKSAKSMGINIPNEIGVIGFSDHIVSEFINPSLSTIRQPTKEIGKEVARRMLRAIDNKNDKNYIDNTTTFFNPELIFRESTALVK